MQHTDCIVCGSKHKEVLARQSFDDHYLDLINPTYQKESRSLSLCSDCGFVFHDPRLDDADMTTLYNKFRDASFRQETPDEYFDRITGLPAEQSENYAKVQWIKKNLGSKVPGKMLDIGCGGGVFMHTLTQYIPGWQGYGIEPTIAFAELAARRLGRPVLAEPYRPGLFPGVKFDLITINQVLEHMADPVGFLRGVQAELADGGHIYLEVPDVEDLSHLPPDHDRFLMQHLWVFSKSSLSNICHQAGYAILQSEQQVTIRNKRNLVFLLQAEAGATKTALLKDDPQWVKSMQAAFQQTSGA